MFTFPVAEEEHWKEDCLSYYLGKVVNIGVRMPGIWLIVQDAEGHYGNFACVLLYKGHMLTYDPATNFTEWIPMRGVSSSLTSVELRSANDLSNIFPCPHSRGEPPITKPPALVHAASLPEMRLIQTVGSQPQTQRSGMSLNVALTGHAAQPHPCRKRVNMGRDHERASPKALTHGAWWWPGLKLGSWMKLHDALPNALPEAHSGGVSQTKFMLRRNSWKKHRWRHIMMRLSWSCSHGNIQPGHGANTHEGMMTLNRHHYLPACFQSWRKQ